MSIFLCFQLEALTSSLWCGPYTPKQKSLFAQVDQLRSEGFKWTEIAKALNDQGITTPRGKQWMGAHAHSVLKKGKIRRLRLGAEAETRVARQRVQKHQINNAANNDSCFDAEMP